MTQSQSPPAISLQLTPMQMPEALPDYLGTQQAALAGIGAIAVAPSRSLLLRPGEASEIVVQIHNLDKRSLQLRLQVEGDFPKDWCQVHTEGAEVRPSQQMEAVLRFQVPSHFFEAPDALGPQERLTLNYRGQLAVYAVESNVSWRQIAAATFSLYLRPPSLYLNYLPAIYREVDFVGRFLAIFEQGFEPAVNILDTLWAYLDPLTASQAMLPFLAHWVGWPLLPQVSWERQRYLIRHAMDIYRWRGTRRGLRFFLHLATGLPLDEELPEPVKHIGISESFSQGFVLGAAQLDQDAILGGGRPFHFTVHLRPDYIQQIDEGLVRRVIEQEKPAFCTYDLAIKVPEDQLCCYSPRLSPLSRLDGSKLVTIF